MNRLSLSAAALGLALVAVSAQAADSGRNTHMVRLADNDQDKRVTVHKKDQTVRRAPDERPNGRVERRTVTERPNGNVVRRTVTERPNGNKVVRKAVRAPRRYHAARAWVAPRGFSYRRFALGERVPSVLLAANYLLSSYWLYGLTPPPPGYVWIREGSDAVLVDRYTGEVVQVMYDVFY